MSRSLLLALSLLVCGCRPYLFGGLGYGIESGEYYSSEDGAIGTYGIGAELPYDLRCEYRHRSMLRKKPEVALNDINCEKRIYFGGNK